ncbi:UDP-N-acetylglucosamine--undecaprenyl-phosphate N-acetylglucosaminephosphotransferase [Paraferrimonas sedimenticola]|uniref:Undecaprenyl-phosphate alpha-N-acetylglucosaminyl 1-phosphate transferase n=1 Tax=Paraferrimonas sedimenticola TaxID=375674 RepID=A0AA37RY18_9GAMM|nr:UDP-N-acetylglucosamine--undecaprenyl-phosphate N-acetylglucosaminephosphotransferase [Paraferrimonas sedimenticola]GLP96757.1 undecaprenyl-phosphate alpha-N-acetylglucosaminyl 1-phosphate transferase [Paraferrimonas sedimenticola]
MFEFTPLAVILASFIGSLMAITLLRKFAQRVGLVDKPDHRKHHQGAVPLVGGIAVFVGIVIGGLGLAHVADFGMHDVYLFLTASTILVVVGAIDDKRDLGVRIRIVCQTIAALIMMLGAGYGIFELGALLDIAGLEIGSISLGWFGYVFTILAVIFAINAFNMVDGIDGLIGGMAVSAFLGLGILYYSVDLWESAVCVLFVAVLLPYLMFNLQLFGNRRKIFMGDAGSMFIGFAVIWMLSTGSQGEDAAFRPVMALYLVAIPIMDMVGIMIRRVRKGQSPFRPDRDHLHHICLRAGFNSWQTLALITTCSLSIVGMGLAMEMAGVAESIMLLVFLAMFALYVWVLNHIWKLLVWFHKLGLVKPNAEVRQNN